MVARAGESGGKEVDGESDGDRSGSARMPVYRQGSCLEGDRFMSLRMDVTMLYQWWGDLRSP